LIWGGFSLTMTYNYDSFLISTNSNQGALMIDYQSIVASFPESREENLRAIKRYSMTEVFFYRSSLWHHSLRVAFIVDAISGIATELLPGFDAKKAFVLALVHDDAEIITGDVQLGHKQVMSQEQLAEVERKELEAIDTLSSQFPRVVLWYEYRQLLLHAAHKDCIEAQLVSYADKVDAYSEAMHEVLGGNISGLRSVIGYVDTIRSIKQRYTLIAQLFERKDVPLLNIGLRTDMWRVHWKNYSHLNKPHTPESILMETEFSFYNSWRELVLKNLREEGMKILTEQIEGKH